MQRVGSISILCINVNVITDTMLKFDANTDANVDFDAKCERIFTPLDTLLFNLLETDLEPVHSSARVEQMRFILTSRPEPNIIDE